MSEKIKKKIGEELYNKVLETGKLKPEDFDIITDGTYVPRTRLNEVNNKLKTTEKKIESYKEQIEETSNLLKDNEELKEKYGSLSEKYEKDIAAKDKEILNNSKSHLVESKLKDSGARHTSLLMKEIDLEKISIDTNNNIIGLDSVIEGLKTSYSDLFEVKKANNTNNTNNKDKDDDSSSDFNDIDWEKEFENIE